MLSGQRLVIGVTRLWAGLDGVVKGHDPAGQVLPGHTVRRTARATGPAAPSTGYTPSGLDHPDRQTALIGPGPNRFGQIHVAVRIRRDGTGYRRDGAHQIIRIHRVKNPSRRAA